MSATCTARARRRPARPFGLKLLQGLNLWYDRWLQRRRLEELTPEALADMGIVPSAARAEAAKPFWRA